MKNTLGGGGGLNRFRSQEAFIFPRTCLFLSLSNRKKGINQVPLSNFRKKVFNPWKDNYFEKRKINPLRDNYFSPKKNLITGKIIILKKNFNPWKDNYFEK